MHAYATPPKQAIAFPEVALIRKGNPKANNQVGKDLNDRFRVQFYPGVDPAIVETFTKAYGPNPQRIKAFIPFPHISEAFSSFNEAHNAGRMIAQADQTHYLMKRNPLSGQYEVRNGEPFTPFQPGEKVTYTNHQGKTIELPVKTTNRLRLVIPEIVMTGRLVTFTFKSTSVYDKFNLEQQLGAIQALANTLNRGNAAGIPFWLYRAEREITWNKPDGSASRIKKWLVHLEPDPEWVQAAFKRMSQFALTGSNAAALPSTLPDPLEVEDDFGEEEEEDDDDGNPPGMFEGTVRDLPPQPKPAPRPAPQPAGRQAPRPPATSLPPTLPPAPAKKTPRAQDADSARLDSLGQQIWNGKWEKVKPAILKQGKDTQGALKVVEARLASLNDFDGLLKHIETNWPEAISYAPLAWGDLAEHTGLVDPLLFLAALQKALQMPGFTAARPESAPDTLYKDRASMIVAGYPLPA